MILRVIQQLSYSYVLRCKSKNLFVYYIILVLRRPITTLRQCQSATWFHQLEKQILFYNGCSPTFKYIHTMSEYIRSYRSIRITRPQRLYKYQQYFFTMHFNADLLDD